MKYSRYFSVLLVFFAMVGFAVACNEDKNDESTTPDQPQPKPTAYELEKVVGGIRNPWGMTFLPDGSLLVTEKAGNLYQVTDGNKTQISGLPEIYVNGQGGLLDITLHPNYEQNGWIYITYASPKGPGQGGHTALMRAKLDGNQLTDQEVLYKAEPNTTSTAHFGSRIEFDNQGYLYFTIGERGNRDVNPQDITRDGGKVYRLNDDGSVPPDNPFTDDPDAVHAIYSYGHRNPQGMGLHPETGKMWIHEHGPKGGDEINVIKKGANYGWPEVSFGVNYDGTSFTDDTAKPGMTQPIHYWVPSIAPCGMAFVTSDKYPDWQGHLLIGSLKFSYLHLAKLNGQNVTEEKRLYDGEGRFRNVKQSPVDDYIYVAVEGKGVFRIVPQFEE